MDESLRLFDNYLTGERWKAKEEESMDREAEIGEGVSCAVSLNGVMVPLRPDGDEEVCWREASSGTVSFHDAEVNILKTLSFCPETGKTTALLAAEVAHVQKVRPDLELVAIAAPDNWTFLEKLRLDEQAVNFFHACEHLGEVADHAVATDWYDRVTLRDAANGVDKVGDTPSPRQGDDENGDRGS